MNKEYINIDLNLNKKYIMSILLVSLIFAGTGFALSSGWSEGNPFHLTSFIDEIRGKSVETVLVSDNLEVTGIMYGEAYSEEYSVDSNEGSETVTMLSAEDYFCFLSKIYHDCDGNCDSEGCEVYVSGGDWILKAYVYDSFWVNNDQVDCSARCIQYGA